MMSQEETLATSKCKYKHITAFHQHKDTKETEETGFRESLSFLLYNIGSVGRFPCVGRRGNIKIN